MVFVALFALAAACASIWILLRTKHRPPSEHSSEANNAENYNANRVNEQKREEYGDEAHHRGGKWNASSVELVTMAGETQPTFLARPIPTVASNQAVGVECTLSKP